MLAARRSLAVAVSAQESRRGGWQSSRTAAGRGDVGGIRRGHETPRFPTTRPAHARRGRRRSVAATTCSRRGARSPSPCRLKRAGAVAGRAAGRPQGAVTSAEFGGVTRPRVFRRRDRRTHDEVGGARSQQRRARGAALARRRRVGSREPARWLAEQQNGRRARWRRRNSAGSRDPAFSDDETGARTTRSAALGRSNDVLAARRSLAVAVSAQESRRGGWQSSRTAAGRGDVDGIRRGHETPRFPTTRPAHARRGRRRSVAATTCSRRGARSPSPCRLKRAGAVAGRAAERPQGAVTSAEFGGVTRPRVFRRRDRRTHDEVGGARSQQRRARGAALARRRRVGSREPARWLAEQQNGRRAR